MYRAPTAHPTNCSPSQLLTQPTAQYRSDAVQPTAHPTNCSPDQLLTQPTAQYRSDAAQACTVQARHTHHIDTHTPLLSWAQKIARARGDLLTSPHTVAPLHTLSPLFTFLRTSSHLFPPVRELYLSSRLFKPVDRGAHRYAQVVCGANRLLQCSPYVAQSLLFNPSRVCSMSFTNRCSGLAQCRQTSRACRSIRCTDLAWL